MDQFLLTMQPTRCKCAKTPETVWTKGNSRTINLCLMIIAWPWNLEKDHYGCWWWRMKQKESEKKCWCWLIYFLASAVPSRTESFIRWKMEINYVTIFLFSSSEAHNKNTRKVVIKNDDISCPEDTLFSLL